MALRNYSALRQYQIHSVRPTGRILGNGAYGEVLEAKIPGAVCAVKKIHRFFETQVRGWVDREMVEENRRKFVQECELMSRLRHPHIVQFLGVCEFPGSDTPALVTELLLTDLHSLLLPRTPRSRSPTKPHIPLGFKYCILRDVARGLLFLHSQVPPIIHRDLTATNVLLNSAMVAKIADLGVARLIPEDMGPLTKGPGNAAYMPPEAQGGAYNESLDVFSLGVVSLLTLTQTFPDPLPVKYQENGQTRYRSEAQRRSAFLEQLPDEVKAQGRLFDAIHQCLYDNPGERPSAHDVLSLLESAAAETSEEFTKKNMLELAQSIEIEREENSLQRVQDERVFQQIVAEKERAFQLALDEREREFQLLMEEKERELAEMQQEKEDAVQQRESEIIEELTGILGDGGDSRGALTRGEGAGSGGMGREQDGIFKATAKPKESSRAVMIIGSNTLPGMWQSLWSKKDVIPLKKAKLSENDSQVLRALGLPPDKWNNLNALLALYNKTELYDVFSVQVSNPGMELSRKYVLGQIEFLLQNSAKKTHGAMLHYCGNGQRDTGDWCFRDGCITFRDITDLYMKHSLGRLLTIVSDCHSSGRWVSECAKFLDEQGVKPCGHSAREKGILLQVAASCQAGQDSAELAYTTRAMELKEDGYVYRSSDKELSSRQHTFGVDFTRVRCGKGEKEKCSMTIEVTWSTAGEVIDHPQSLLGGANQGMTSEQQQQAVTELEEKIKTLNQNQLSALMIIGSTTPPTGRMQSSVVPQFPAQLSEDDRQVLTGLGIPPDKWNNLNALWAHYNQTEYGVLSLLVRRPGMELGRSHVLEQIELVFKNAEKAVILHYYGNGRRDTGDWCFRDGCITFRDITDLYMKHSLGRLLTIVSDCHSSGRWVSECARFLDEQGVKPCGHSAREKGILLQVVASCQTGQDSAELAFTTRAMKASYKAMHYWLKIKLSTQQHTRGVVFTSILCGRREEECNIPSGYTWQKTFL